MKTYTDAKKYVTRALGDHTDEYHIDGILDEVYDILGHWDVAQLDTDAESFWKIIKKHITTRTPKALLKVYYLHTRIKITEGTVGDLVCQRSDAIREALDAGHTQTDVASGLDTSQPRVSYMLKQGIK